MSPDPVPPIVVLPQPLSKEMEARIGELMARVAPTGRGYADVAVSTTGVGGGAGVKLGEHASVGGWVGLNKNQGRSGWSGLAAGVRAAFTW